MAKSRTTRVDADAAVTRLVRFLAVPGVTGHEKKIAREVVAALREVGVSPKQVRHDTAHERIPLPTETGNLFVDLPGTAAGPRLLFMAHLDTVPLCAGAKPVRKGNKIVNEAASALGGDDRTGVSVLVTLAATLAALKLPHPPITLLFTVREESGLFGARFIDLADIAGVGMAFNFDGRSAREVTVGAVGAERWEVAITGRAAHAGVAPEKGVSATVIAGLAIAEVFAGGWFGKVNKDGRFGTSNIGSVGDAQGRSAGEATNVVTDFALIHGESRSHDPKFAREITQAYKAAFTNAALRVTDDQGRPGKAKFSSRLDYHPFRLPDDAPAVRRAAAAVERLGNPATLKVANGGLDANWMVKHGLPAVTLGAGQNAIHTVDEFVDLTEYLAGCELAVELATAPAE